MLAMPGAPAGDNSTTLMAHTSGNAPYAPYDTIKATYTPPEGNIYPEQRADQTNHPQSDIYPPSRAFQQASHKVAATIWLPNPSSISELSPVQECINQAFSLEPIQATHFSLHHVKQTNGLSSLLLFL